MNIWHYELRNDRSAAVRLALRLFVFLLSFAFVWLLLQPPRVTISLLGGAVVYFSLVGFVLDHWKLRHPETSRLRFQWVATLAMLPILVGFPIMIFMFR